jgi:voltage-gated potassium channel
MHRHLKGRLYDILEDDSYTDAIERYVNGFILLLIVMNVLAVILSTVKSLQDTYGPLFFWFEVFSVAVFSIEYLIRLWICTFNPRFADPVKGRLKYAITPMALVDIGAILPFYLFLLTPMDFTGLMLIRLFRIFRLLKIVRYSESVLLFGRILKRKKDDLVMATIVGLFALVLFSSLMYFAEHTAQPDKFGSIPESMWWGVVTLATIGYGDVFPITTLGKFFGMLTAIAGIGIFALPAGILGSGFVEEMEKRHACDNVICPHCGKPFIDSPIAKEVVIMSPKERQSK